MEPEEDATDFALVPSAGPVDRRRRLRLEDWATAAGPRAHLLVACTHGLALVHAVTTTPDGRTLLCGSTLCEGDAPLSCREGLLATVPLVPATRQALAGLGIHTGGLPRLALILERAFEAIPEGFTLKGVPHLGDCGEAPGAPILGHHLESFRGRIRANSILWPDIPRSAPAPDPSRPATVHEVPPGDQGAMGRPLEPWHRALERTCLPGPLAELGPDAWTPDAFRFLAEPGEAGRRRAQAARLQPGFLPTLAADPGLAALVDAGRPFEPALRDLVGTHLGGPGGGLTMAKLRRFRTVGPTPHLNDRDGFGHAIEAAARLPVALLPADRAGWDNLLRRGSPLLRFALGLPDPVTFLAGVPADWDLTGRLPPRPAYDRLHPRDALEAELSDLGDMLRRCADTLVRDCLPWTRRARHEARGVARDLLLGGRSFRAAFLLQRAWHDGLARFDETIALDEHLSWPALFEPFDAGGGVRIRCLVDSAELRAEGAHGVDGDGRPGLAHCVGGYARACHEGRCHILSVSRGTATGAHERLSTVELVLRGTQPIVAQHRGRGNGPPPEASNRAMAILVGAIAAGAVPLAEPGAIAAAAEAALRIPRDRAATAFEAWRPYLPRRIARGGPESLVREHPEPEAVRPAA